MATKTLDIAGKRYNVEEIELDQSTLKFYLENPRVYSSIRINNDNPTQEEIESAMKKMEHVKKLRLAIETNGGLIDPIIVRNSDRVVLEGNSRLAAYRILCEKNPMKWGMIKCVILPDEVTDDAVFTLLGQYHIVGRKDWSPYEQAGYLYRRKKNTKLPVEEMAKELGIAAAEAKRLVSVYELMLKNSAFDPEKWSYFDELSKNRGIKSKAKKDPTFVNKVVTKIIEGKIDNSHDIRKIGEIAGSDDAQAEEITQQFLDDEISLEKAHVTLQEAGVINDDLTKLTKFRELIGDGSYRTKLLNSNDEVKEKIKFELSLINSIITTLLSKI